VEGAGRPQLDALINEALRGTPTLAAADARLRSAIAQAGLADSLRKPSLAVGAQYAGLRIPETVGPGSFGGSYQGIVLLTMNFKYDPTSGARSARNGRRRSARRAQWNRSSGGAADARVERRIDLRGACAGTRRTGCRRRRKGARLASVGSQPPARQAGLDSQLPLRQAEAGVAAAQQQAEAAQQHIDAARNALAALLGKGSRPRAVHRKTYVADGSAPGVPSVLPSELLGHRPDVVAARWRVEAAERGIASSKAAFYPTVNLSALVDWHPAG
jgi:outer membrane protein TolC